MTPEEKEVSKAFSTYWKAHFSRKKGAFEKVLSLWHPDITAIGTGKDEIVKTFTGFKKFLKREFDEVSTTMPVKILWTKVQLQKDLALVLAETEVIVSKEKNIKMRFRQSSVFKKQRNKWLLFHIHGSFPASAQRENESFPIDGLIAEKEKLEKEVAEKTADLLNKNRELEIEAALERVRAIAMGMHKSEDLLNVSEILYLELQKLGFDEMRNAMINIHNDENKTFINYDYSDVIGKSKTLLNFNTHPVMEKQIKQSRIANDAFSEAVYKGKDLEEWKEFRKKYGEKDDPRIDKINALYYYFYSIGSGTIGISTFSQINEEKLTLLKRFRNVFSLAYQRYSDIALAEEQAREAQIEAALERIRSRALSMRHSSEVGNVTNIFFSELENMGINTLGCSINALDKTKTRFDHWRAKQVAVVKQFESYSYKEMIEQLRKYVPNFTAEFEEGWKSGKPYLSYQFAGEERKLFFIALSNIYNYSEKQKQKMMNSYPDPFDYYTVFFGNGFLRLTTSNHLPETELLLCKRFTEVFDFAYTRFLDLQKAEAQAREAQIELGLERVRARAMAMHKSEELNDVVMTLFDQMKDLEIDIDGININILNDNLTGFDSWFAAPGYTKAVCLYTPYFDTPAMNDIFNAVKNKWDLLSKIYPKEEKDAYFTYLYEHSDYKNLPHERKKMILDAESWCLSVGIANNTGISIHSYTGKTFSEKEHDILKRFAKVFSQTYTRFLDLQKAEAQAREAQIEAALERVRSRTMGMQKSEELKEVIQIVYEEFVNLNIHIEHTGFVMDYKARDDYYIWIADQHGAPSQITIPYFDSLYYNRFNEAKEKGEDFFATKLTFEEKNRFYQKLFKYIPELPEKAKEFYFSCPGLAGSTVLLENVCLYIENFDGIPYTDEENNTLMRFGKVFQQTYTRFNDLKQAEAQSRESQIEAALERVRSRTMAMQQSDELAETASVVFKQLITLGIEPNRIYIVIIKDENGLGEFWITDEDGSKVSSGFTASLNDNRAFQKIFKGWKEKKKSITLDMQGEELQEYFRHLTSINVPFKGGLSQKRRLQYISYFSNGFIGVASPDEMKPETPGLLERFAAVFNLTYTRFNDLQQAEAQNKIIQAENERKTKELEEARELQLAMLPKEIPEYPGLDIKVYMQTATEVGGDYYDFSFRDDGSINIAIGDATGHGMKAGTLVTMMKSLFTANSSNKNIEEFFTSSNAAIKNSNLKRMMAGFAMINIKDHKAKYINAAMPPVYHYKKKESKVEEIKQHNLPLGAMKIEKYNATEINLNIGDVLIMMSDGFPELHNPVDELFGYERVFSSFEKAAEAEPVEIIRYLNEESARWTKDKELEDDVTFVVIKIK